MEDVTDIKKDEIIIDDGVIELDINRGGKVVGVFRFNPSDLEESERHARITEEIEKNHEEQAAKAKEIDEKGSTLDGIEYLKNFVVDMHDKIDCVYGSGTSKLLFGECKSIDMIVSFFNQLQPYYEKASQKRREKYKN